MKGKGISVKKQIGITMIVTSIILLVLTTFEFLFAVKKFFLGAFGIMFYPILAFVALFGVAFVLNKKFVYSVKYLVYLFMCFFFTMCVLHIIFTGFKGVNYTYGSYLASLYNTMYTPGGVVIGVFTFPITSLLHDIAGIVIYAILLVISIYLVVNYLEGVKNSSKKVVLKESKNNYDAFKIIEEENNFTNNKRPQEEVKPHLEEVEEKQEKEEDIFIEDEDLKKLEEAREKLGLTKKQEEVEKIPKESAEERLFNEKYTSTWQNRSFDKPQKHITNYTSNSYKTEENEKEREYINSIRSVATNNENPIINAEDYEDYKEKMRLYNERMTSSQNTQQKSYEVEKKVEEIDPLKDYKGERIVRDENTKYQGDFVQKVSSYISSIEKKPEHEIIQEKFENPIKQDKDDETFSYNYDVDLNEEVVDNSSLENDIESSKIVDLEEDYIKPKAFEKSPLNPDNFNPIKLQEEVKEEPKFVDETYKTSQSENISDALGQRVELNTHTFNFDAFNGSKSEENKPVDPNFSYSSKYVRPPIELLKTYINEEDESLNMEQNINTLERVLDEFKIPAKVEAVRRGAAVTRYELRMPTGISVNRIHTHASDIALALAAKSDVRIQTPIRGKSAVGIEVPNNKIDTVGLKDIISSSEFRDAKAPLTFALGKDIDGNVYCCNIDKMPHLLVAGSTGSGKSVCLNALILSLMYKTSPEDLRFIMVDPKKVEFNIYSDLPHMLMPEAISDTKKALNAFDWLINEMERRYTLFQECVVRNLAEYNSQQDVLEGRRSKLPYIVLIVDELADLVVTMNKKELDERIIRLTQKARAAGIHLILATQRPSVDIITGVIKTNLPTRIAFAVTNAIDSRTILDQVGAEKLLGRGDMLYSPRDGEPIRVQGAFVDTPEIKAVVDFIKANNPSYYDDNIAKIINSDKDGGGSANNGTGGFNSTPSIDSLMPDALKVVIENNNASISMLQRRFAIGYQRAAKIIDQMEQAGFISSSDGSKPRTVFITMADYNKIYNGN